MSTALFACLIAGCAKSDQDYYDDGFADGKVGGYEMTCKKTMPTKNSDNKHYIKGYAAGLGPGIAKCVAERKAEGK